jgi:hypothetical protein
MTGKARAAKVARPTTARERELVAFGHAQGSAKANKAAKKKNKQESADAKKKAKTDNAEAQAKLKDKKSPNYAALAGLGIGVAAATTILSVALAEYIASDGAIINLTNISPLSLTASFVPSFFGQLFTPTKFEISWSVKEPGEGGLADNVTILKGNSVTIKGTGIKSIDDKTHTVLDVPSDNVFVIDSKMSDCSKEQSNTGTGEIDTEYNDNLNDNVAAATNVVAGGLGGVAGGLGEGLMKNLGTILFFIALIIGSFALYKFFTSIGPSR